MTYTNLLILIPPCIMCAIAVATFYLTERRIKSNREIEFSKKIYQDYLLVDLPKAINTYSGSKGHDRSSAELSYLLRDFRNDMHYFKYVHNNVYQQLLAAVSTIDYAIEHQENENTIATNVLKINESLHQIYKAFLFDLPDDHIDRYFRLK